MSKRASRAAPRASSQPSSIPPAPAAPELAATPSASTWEKSVALGWLALTIGYFLFFLRGSVGGSGDAVFPRWRFLTVWLIPDEIAKEWVGGDWSQFAFLDRLPIALAAAAHLAAAWLAGRLLLERFQADRGMTALEVHVFSFGAGLAALSTWTLAVGLAGGLRQPLWWIAPILGMAAWLAWRRREWLVSHFTGVSRRTKANPEKPRSQGAAAKHSPKRPANEAFGLNWLWLAAPFVAVILLGGFIPSTHFDVREYHLQVPKEWHLAGRIGFLPHNVYGNMPLGAEMHPLMAMCLWPGAEGWWWGALVGKTVIACFAPLTAAALLAFGRRFYSTTAGVVAAVVYISVPWIVSLSKEGMIDGVVAGYLFLSFYAVALWRLGVPTTQARGVALAGFLAGAAAACKYPAVLMVAAPLGLWVAFAGRALQFRAAAVFTAAALVAGGLWYAKNWVIADNPVYPLLYSVFGGQTRTPEKDLQWRAAHAVPSDGRGRHYTPSQFVDGVRRVLYESQRNSPLVIPLAALALVLPRWRRHTLALFLCFLFVFLVWWLATHRIDRFWLPGLPLLAMLAGAGADWSAARVWRWSLGVVLAAGLALNFGMAATIFSGDNQFFVPLQTLRRANPWYDSLSHAAPPGWKILMVGDAQVFDIAAPTLYNTCFDDCRFEQIMKGRSAQERLEELHRRKIALVVVDWPEIRRYRSTYGYSDYIQVSVIQELIEQQVLQPPIPPFPPNVKGFEDERLPPQVFGVSGSPVDLAQDRPMR